MAPGVPEEFQRKHRKISEGFKVLRGILRNPKEGVTGAFHDCFNLFQGYSGSFRDVS